MTKHTSKTMDSSDKNQSDTNQHLIYGKYKNIEEYEAVFDEELFAMMDRLIAKKEAEEQMKRK